MIVAINLHPHAKSSGGLSPSAGVLGTSSGLLVAVTTPSPEATIGAGEAGDDRAPDDFRSEQTFR